MRNTAVVLLNDLGITLHACASRGLDVPGLAPKYARRVESVTGRPERGALCILKGLFAVCFLGFGVVRGALNDRAGMGSRRSRDERGSF